MSVPHESLPFKIEADHSLGGMTAHAGIPLIIDALRRFGVSQDLAKLGISRRKAEVRDTRMSEAMVALVAAGGEHLSDIEALRRDPGLVKLLGGPAALPDARRLGEFLAAFHDPKLCEEVQRGKAVVPHESAPLCQLGEARWNIVERVQKLSPSRLATLDWDTQIIESDKREALVAYDGRRGYQPAAIRWFEQGLVVADQFRPGNVPSGFQLKPLVKTTIDRLATLGVETFEFRGDSAAYDWKLLEYLATRRQGAVRFAVTADKCRDMERRIRAIPETKWRLVRERTEQGLELTPDRWAEFEFVTNAMAKSKIEKPLRYIAIWHGDERESPKDGVQRLPGMGGFVGGRYHVIVTNRAESGEEVIRWHRGRCGTIERVFRVLNNDQAAASPPSGLYGANAAWYRYNVILYDVVHALRMLALPEPLKHRELKGLRLLLLNVAGGVVRRSRSWILKIFHLHPALDWLRHTHEALVDVARELRLAFGAT